MEREWTPGRVIGWVLVVLGLFLHWRVYLTDAGYFGHQVAAVLWWSGGWILFWSWILWRRRKWQYDREVIREQVPYR